MTRFIKCLIGMLAASACWSAAAEDIDLFLGAQSASGDQPQVLFIIDNTANWTQAFDNEMGALRNVFNGLPTDKIQVGVMLAAETSSSDSNVQGGYVRAAIRPMNEDTQPLYAAMFAAMDVGRDKGNSGQSSLVMAEAYRYLSGGAARSGNNKAKADYTGNTAVDWSSAATTPASKAAMKAIYALPGNALGSKNAATYNSPGAGTSCSKRFIIYLSNGPSQDSSSIISAAKSMLQQAGGDTTTIPLPIAGSQDNVTDEWARFLNDRMGVITYTIEVNKKTSGQGPGWSSLLENMALSNGGTYQDVSSDAPDIEKAIRDVLTQIQATNSVFASVSLPLSASAQGTYLNQVYVGLFRPDGATLPRWAGNLKQYKLGYSGADLRLQDSLGGPAVDASTGFVRICSKSYWTRPNRYWNFRSQQFEDQAGCAVENESFPPAGSDYPDGKFVEKGGQAQSLRATLNANRQLATCTGFNCSSVTNFNVSNVTGAMLGVSDDTQRQKIVNWARGQDIQDEHTTDSVTPSGATSKAMRPSVHGDVVHSRPVAINFGTDTDPEVVVFYAANDGVLRAINGNRPSVDGEGLIDGVAPGGELWGFVPPEFHRHFKRLYENDVPISFPNVTTGAPEPKPYAMDGAITAHRDGSKASVFATMRRGGRAVYAFDVDADHPSDIELAWKIGCDNSQCTSSDLEDLGQTWSPARPLLAKGYSAANTPQPLLIMGGGYDACEDARPNQCTSSSKGDKVYVLDAATGDVERSFDTERGVIAEVAVVPDLTTGLALYAYAVDLGGNVYRIDIGDAAPEDWTMRKIASLGCDTANASCVHNRKFMFAPDILLENGAYVLLLGSGDREKPREYASTVQNYFFMLKDKPQDATWLTSEAGNCSAAVLCLNSLTPILDEQTPTTEQLAAKKGWYLGLNPTEQVVTSAITIFGNLTFSTHEPATAAPATCSANLGLARVYNMSYVNAAGQSGGTQNRSAELPPDIGLPPSPVAGLVTLDDGRTVPFCIGCTADSPLEGSEPKIPPSSLPAQPKNRVYWYIER